MGTQGGWPRNGFEPLFEYVTNFIHLNINLGSEEACKKYHDRWMARYSKVAQSWDEFEIAAWTVRLRQSLKLAFSGTYFALSSRELKDQGAIAASYYLAYYAAMHAMWSVVYLLPDLTHEKVTQVGHGALTNIFAANFTGSKAILQYDIKALVEDLRFLREYYSYRMPLNSPVPPDSEVAQAHIHLGGLVKQSLQLANLHSHLIRKAAERCGKQCASVAPRDSDRFRSLFFDMNGKQHPARNMRALDPADRHAERESLEHGCDILPLSLAYDHMFDDFMTYVDDRTAQQDIAQRTRALVGNAFF
jgi:hypothetical protein